MAAGLALSTPKLPLHRGAHPHAPTSCNVMSQSFIAPSKQSQASCASLSSSSTVVPPSQELEKPAIPDTRTHKRSKTGVWYFAFGSNLCPSVLEGRRGVKPLESVACCVEGYSLVFNVRGFAYSEPAFAAVKSRQCDAGGVTSGVDVHGVAFRVTPGDWARICATEWASKDGFGSYTITKVQCKSYSGEKVEAFTLTAGELMKVPEGVTTLPSQRYMNVIRRGAQYHGLAAEYQEYLSSLPCYQPPSDTQAKLGALLYGAGSVPLLLPVVGPLVAVRMVAKEVPELEGPVNAMATGKAVTEYIQSVSWVAQWWHDNLIRPICGSGFDATNALPPSHPRP